MRHEIKWARAYVYRRKEAELFHSLTTLDTIYLYNEMRNEPSLSRRDVRIHVPVLHVMFKILKSNMVCKQIRL